MNQINKIKQKPNDIKMTPLALAKLCIDMTPIGIGDILMDGCKGTGNFYNQFPNNPKLYCEINEGIDFFTNNKEYDWFITNPPWSKITQTLIKACSQARKGIGILIGVMNLTPKRLQIIEDCGFKITNIHFSTVTGWLGACAYIICQKQGNSFVTFSRKPFHMPGKEHEQFQKSKSQYMRNYRAT